MRVYYVFVPTRKTHVYVYNDIVHILHDLRVFVQQWVYTRTHPPTYTHAVLRLV